MHKKHVYALLLAAVFCAVLISARNILRVDAQPLTVYIRANGDVEPATVSIQRDGDVYTFTGDIAVDGSATGLIIERDNMTLDGAGYRFSRLSVSVPVNGLELTGRTNVTIKNLEVTTFFDGIVLNNSSNNKIQENTITNNNNDGVGLYSSWNNTVSGNTITNSMWIGVRLFSSSNNNNVSGNNVTDNTYGVRLENSFNNTVSENIIADNDCGIRTILSESNEFYHNHLNNNTVQANVTAGYVNTWDDGYPSGGNYWSDYVDVDVYSGPNQDEAGSDGIWDNPYVIEEYNQDNYPIIPEFSSVLIPLLLMILTPLIARIYRTNRETLLKNARAHTQ